MNKHVVSYVLGEHPSAILVEELARTAEEALDLAEAAGPAAAIRCPRGKNHTVEEFRALLANAELSPA